MFSSRHCTVSQQTVRRTCGKGHRRVGNGRYTGGQVLMQVTMLVALHVHKPQSSLKTSPTA